MSVGPQLLEYVYYYCPLLPSPPLGSYAGSISDILSYTYPDQYDMVQLTFKWITSPLSNVTIAMTPEAYTLWYLANETYILSAPIATSLLTPLYNTLIAPQGTAINAQVVQNNFTLQNGYLSATYADWTSTIDSGGPGLVSGTYMYLNQSKLYAYYNPANNNTPTFQIPNWLWFVLIGGGIIILLMVIFRGFSAGAGGITAISGALKGSGSKGVHKNKEELAEAKANRETQLDIARTYANAKQTSATKKKVAAERSQKSEPPAKSQPPRGDDMGFLQGRDV